MPSYQVSTAPVNTTEASSWSAGSFASKAPGSRSGSSQQSSLGRSPVGSGLAREAWPSPSLSKSERPSQFWSKPSYQVSAAVGLTSALEMPSRGPAALSQQSPSATVNPSPSTSTGVHLPEQAERTRKARVEVSGRMRPHYHAGKRVA